MPVNSRLHYVLVACGLGCLFFCACSSLAGPADSPRRAAAAESSDRPVASAETDASANRALGAAWRQLASNDPSRAFAAIRCFEQAGSAGTKELARRLHPVGPIDPDRVAALVDRLGHHRYSVRTEAHGQLLALGPAIRDCLDDARRLPRDVESRRRLADLLAWCRRSDAPTAQLRRICHAIRALERQAGDDARAQLERLASGTPGARVTAWAAAALRRLDARDTRAHHQPMLGADPQRTSYVPIRPVRRKGRVAWRVDLGEYRYPRSGVVCAGSSAYVVVDDASVGPMLTSRLFAVDLDRREVRWQYGQSRLTIRTTPAVLDDHVYVGVQHPDGTWALHAVGAESGQVSWKSRSGGAILSSPVAADATVYYACQAGQVHGLDARLGQPIWSVHLPRGIEHPLAISGEYVIAADSQRLYALERGSGERVWQSRPYALVGPPAACDGKVYAVVCPTRTTRARLVALSERSGAELFSTPLPTSDPGAVALADGHVYVPAGQYVLCVDAGTGAIRWRTRLESSLCPWVVAAGEMLHVASESDSRLMALCRRTGTPAWSVDTHCRRIWGPPAAGDQVLYFASRRWKLCAVTEPPAATVAAADPESPEP